MGLMRDNKVKYYICKKKLSYYEEYIESISNNINNLLRKIHWSKTLEEIFYWKIIK